MDTTDWDSKAVETADSLREALMESPLGQLNVREFGIYEALLSRALDAAYNLGFADAQKAKP